MGKPPKKSALYPNGLKRLRNAAGFTQDEAASRFSLSKGGYIKIEDGERRLSADRIAKACEIYGVDSNAVVSAGGESVSPAKQRSGVVPAARAFRFLQVVGKLSAGVFRDAEVFSDHLDEMISAPPSLRFPWARQIAWQSEGDSMNKAEPQPINDGDFVVGLSYEDIQEAVPLKSGLNVIIRQTRDGGQTYEWTVKELVLTETTAEFHPRSDNPRHKPIITRRDLEADDGRKVEVLALVQYVFNNQETAF